MDPVLINRQGYKFGAMAGILGILVLYIGWYLGIETYASVQSTEGFIPYMLALIVLGGLQLRKNNNGYINFKEALKYAFLAYVISAVLMAIATYILHNVIDKDLSENSFKVMLGRLETALKKENAPPAYIKEQMETALKSKPVTDLKNVILGLGLALIFSFMKSLAVTLLIRKEKPVSFEL
jgi:hypothetical protein